jgi:hypothetical protein
VATQNQLVKKPPVTKTFVTKMSSPSRTLQAVSPTTSLVFESKDVVVAHAPPSRAHKRRQRARRHEGKDVKSDIALSSPSLSSNPSLKKDVLALVPTSLPRIRDYGNYPDFRHPTDREGRRLLAARMLEIVATGSYQPMRDPIEKTERTHINLSASFTAAIAATRLIRVNSDELKIPITVISSSSKSSASSSSSSSTSIDSTLCDGSGVGSGSVNIRISANTSVGECLSLWNTQYASLGSTVGFHLAVLNFASGANPGGGGLSGAQAQEESLIRVSSLHSCLDSPHVATFLHRGSPGRALLRGCSHLVTARSFFSVTTAVGSCREMK